MKVGGIPIEGALLSRLCLLHGYKYYDCELVVGKLNFLEFGLAEIIVDQIDVAKYFSYELMLILWDTNMFKWVRVELV